MNIADESIDGDLLAEARPKKKKANLYPQIVAALVTILMIGIFLIPEEESPIPVDMPDPTVSKPISSMIQSTSTPKSAPTKPVLASVQPKLISAATAKPIAPKLNQSAAAGAGAREIIAEFRANKTNVDFDQVFIKAEQFKAEKMLTDAHLLYFYAARNGHGSAAMMLATMYDPDYHSESTSIMDEPDIAQAYKWYQQAVKGGNLMAKAHLNDLRTRVELAAANGDVKAEQLFLQWQLGAR